MNRIQRPSTRYVRVRTHQVINVGAGICILTLTLRNPEDLELRADGGVVRVDKDVVCAVPP
jgi:hypothetical protein